ATLTPLRLRWLNAKKPPPSMAEPALLKRRTCELKLAEPVTIVPPPSTACAGEVPPENRNNRLASAATPSTDAVARRGLTRDKAHTPFTWTGTLYPANLRVNPLLTAWSATRARRGRSPRPSPPSGNVPPTPGPSRPLRRGGRDRGPARAQRRATRRVSARACPTHRRRRPRDGRRRGRQPRVPPPAAPRPAAGRSPPT